MVKLLLKQLENNNWVGIITWHKKVWYRSDEYPTADEAKKDALNFGENVAHWW